MADCSVSPFMSVMFTMTNSTSLPCSSQADWMSGISLAQGPHQLAQKSISTFCPGRLASIGKFSLVNTVIAMFIAS